MFYEIMRKDRFSPNEMNILLSKGYSLCGDRKIAYKNNIPYSRAELISSAVLTAKAANNAWPTG